MPKFKALRILGVALDGQGTSRFTSSKPAVLGHRSAGAMACGLPLPGSHQACIHLARQGESTRT